MKNIFKIILNNKKWKKTKLFKCMNKIKNNGKSNNKFMKMIIISKKKKKQSQLILKINKKVIKIKLRF